MSKSPTTEEEFQNLKAILAAQQEQIAQLTRTLSKSGMTTRAEIKIAVEELTGHEQQYYGMFCYKASTLIKAYKSGTQPAQDSTVAEVLLVDVIKEGVSIATGMAVEAAKNVPVVGSVVAIASMLANKVCDAQCRKMFSHKTDAIKNVVTAKFTITKEDESNCISQLALAMTKARSPMNAPAEQGSVYGAELALQDVNSFMTYLFTQSDQIVRSPLSFVDQIPNFVSTVLSPPTTFEASQGASPPTQQFTVHDDSVQLSGAEHQVVGKIVTDGWCC